MKISARVLFLLIFALSSAAGLAAASDSRFFAPVPEGAAARDDGILVVYLHSSLEERQADLCEPLDPASPGGVPPVIAGLAGRELNGYRIYVYAYCGEAKFGSFDQQDGSGETKVAKRAREVRELVGRLRAEGWAGHRIFLAGHSAGAWAALLVARRDSDLGGTIALAPAFAGPRQGRSRAWRAERARQAADLAGAMHLPSLVYTFTGDAYEGPNSLKFLAVLPGVDFRALPNDRIDGVPCGLVRPHAIPAEDCFTRTQAAEVLGFIEARLEVK